MDIHKIKSQAFIVFWRGELVIKIFASHISCVSFHHFNGIWYFNILDFSLSKSDSLGPTDYT